MSCTLTHPNWSKIQLDHKKTRINFLICLLSCQILHCHLICQYCLSSTRHHVAHGCFLVLRVGNILLLGEVTCDVTLICCLSLSNSKQQQQNIGWQDHNAGLGMTKVEQVLLCHNSYFIRLIRESKRLVLLLTPDSSDNIKNVTSLTLFYYYVLAADLLACLP